MKTNYAFYTLKDSTFSILKLLKQKRPLLKKELRISTGSVYNCITLKMAKSSEMKLLWEKDQSLLDLNMWWC